MIICANFKTNHTRESFKTYLSDLLNLNTTHEIRIYPPFTALTKIKTPPHVKIGVQNFYPIKNGSYTGEIGLEQLKEFNINSVLIGHSERRHILGETDELIKQKFNFSKEQKFEIIYCIGESKQVRDNGKEAVLKYLNNQLESIDLDYKNLIIAYEPVWAIGTGVVAKPEDIKEVLDFLRTKTLAPLLYGGSVKPSNVEQTYRLENCNGVLVGTASWKVENFKELIKKADY